MKISYHDDCIRRGSTLVDVVIAIGVLAVAIPWVFETLAAAGKCALVAQAESRSSWMIRVCMDEMRASRAACPQYFSSTSIGEIFPPGGEVWALAFAADGKVLGKISRDHYDHGIREADGRSVRYIGRIESMVDPEDHGVPLMLRAHISVEFPAALPVGKRRAIDFYTRIQ